MTTMENGKGPAVLVDAAFIRNKVAQLQARAQHGSGKAREDRAKTLADIVRMIDKAPKKTDYAGVCGGCVYYGRRRQKCACCARNAHIKDCYRSE